MRRAAVPVAIVGVLAFAAVAGNLGALSPDHPAPDGGVPTTTATVTAAGPPSGSAKKVVDTPESGCEGCDAPESRGLLSLLPDGPWASLAGLLAALGLLLLAGWYLRAPSTPHEAGTGPDHEAGPADEAATDWTVPAPAPRNEVERAWRSLRERVRADRSRTPAEVARAAVDRGFDADAVREVTTLFTRVRYGDAGATVARERRAARAATSLDGAGKDDTVDSGGEGG